MGVGLSSWPIEGMEPEPERSQCADDWLTEEVLQPGLHVCEPSAPAADGAVALTVRFDGSKAGRRADVVLSADELADMAGTRCALEAKLALPPRPPPQQPWALFSVSGERLTSTERLLAVGVFLLIEGGQYVRPGVRVGHKQRALSETGRPLEVETVSLTPLIFSIKNFLTPEDCAHVIEKASGLMFNSPVVNMDKDLGKKATEWRTSRQAWLESDMTPTIAAMSERVARLVACPASYQESLQVLSYALRQKYDVHLDAFDPQFYQQKPDFLERIDHGHRNRLATAFWYMTSVEEGGETIFPRAGGKEQRDSLWPFDCVPAISVTPPPTGLAHPHVNNVDELQRERVGLLVPPEQGKIIIFYNLLPK